MHLVYLFKLLIYNNRYVFLKNISFHRLILEPFLQSLIHFNYIICFEGFFSITQQKYGISNLENHALISYDFVLLPPHNRAII